MLYLLLKNPMGEKIYAKFNDFLHSFMFPAIVAALAAASNIFGLEIAVWCIFILLGSAVVLLSKDTLPLAPIIFCSYITVSTKNNPAKYYGDSLFQNPTSVAILAVIAGLAVLLLCSRFIYDMCIRRREGKSDPMPAFTAGLVLLSAAYIVSGALSSGNYAPQWKSSLFGLTEAACLIIPYFYFYYTVDWSSAPKLYFAEVFVSMGLAVALEVVGIYHFALSHETFTRDLLNTGWGVYNNVGFVIAFCIPCAFLLAVKRRHGWIYALLGAVLELALIFTQSRGSILFGTMFFFASVAMALVFAEKRERKFMLIAAGVALVVLLIAAIIFKDKLIAIFTTVVDAGFNDSNRFNIYKLGFGQFTESILFGNGFYAGRGQVFIYGYEKLPADAFLPPRYHNTIIQLAATGGLFALAAYGIHRLQTLYFFLHRPTVEKTFALFSVLVLTTTSLLDCHFFNLAPGLMYSFILVCAERQCEGEPTESELLQELQPA